jgi:hypothetical protein
MGYWTELESPTRRDQAEFRNAPQTKFLADENVEPVLIKVLREQKLNVRTVDDYNLRGKSDQTVYAALYVALLLSQ